MPDSFGKRNRDAVKARKAAAREDRRIARNQRRKGIVVQLEPNRLSDIPFGTPASEDARTTGTES